MSDLEAELSKLGRRPPRPWTSGPLAEEVRKTTEVVGLLVKAQIH